MAPMIFFFKFSGYIFLNYFIKNPQTTIAFTFLTYIISAIGGVLGEVFKKKGGKNSFFGIIIHRVFQVNNGFSNVISHTFLTFAVVYGEIFY